MLRYSVLFTVESLSFICFISFLYLDIYFLKYFSKILKIKQTTDVLFEVYEV